MKLSCLIIEDEPLALERMCHYVKKISYLELKGTFYSSLEAMAFLKSNQVDVVFLDIEMDELNGLELIEALTSSPEIVLTTAHEKYALKGFELNVSDYLLKPFSFNRFLKAVETVSHKFENLEKKSNPFIFLKSAYRIEKIAIDDISFIEGMRDYRNVQTASRKVLVLQTFGELETLLPQDKFCRVHKSYVVAIAHIEFVERNSIQVSNKRIPISNTYEKQFFDKIGFSS